MEQMPFSFVVSRATVEKAAMFTTLSTTCTPAVGVPLSWTMDIVSLDTGA